MAKKYALIIGIANENSIAYGCAKALKDSGHALAVTYLNAKAERFVRPLAETLGAEIIAPLDVSQPGQMQALFETIIGQWGKLDTVLHSIAFCPKDDLHGRVVDCSATGFGQAMDISVHSFLRLIQQAEPLMQSGGTCMTVSFYGSEKVVDHYNIMGPVKAALESCTRYLAMELGDKNIRVNAISPGPIATRAASGIQQFDKLLSQAASRAPLHHNITLEDVGNLATFLVSDLAKNITGGVHYVDCGYEITA